MGWVEKSKKYVMHGWGFSDIVIERAKGDKFWDSTGKEYLDFLSQTAGVLGIGHSHPKVIAAVENELEKVQHTLTMFTNEPRAILGEKLAKICPGKLRDNVMSYFSCGGSEANETALKVAMKVTGKREVISVYHSYHGGTLGLMGLLGQAPHREGFVRYPGQSQIPNSYCYRCYFGQKYPGCDFECARILEHHLKWGSSKDGVAAFIIEPIQGNGGHMTPPEPTYFKIIRETCDDYNVLLIDDEVQTGMGRTGKNWAAEYFNFSPDIMTTAKALGGGLPVSAAAVRSDLVKDEVFHTGQWHIFTMGGGPVLAASAVAALNVLLEEKLAEKAARQGQRMTKRLKEMQPKHKMMGEVRGPGLFVGVELVKDKGTKEPAPDETLDVFVGCLEKGVLFGISAVGGVGNVIKMKPPLAVGDEDTDKALDIFEEVLTDVERKL
ncbi:MAG: aspartate aminotransferase family protein [Promethearchaeota archaeon]